MKHFKNIIGQHIIHPIYGMCKIVGWVNSERKYVARFYPAPHTKWKNLKLSRKEIESFERYS